MTQAARLTVFLTCAAAVAAALEPAGRQEGPGAPVRQLAYLKASNSEAFDHFACGGSLPGHIGNALAVSGDGNTIAVGAPHESSAARGINGNQDDNSLYNSGAVYVYVRRGDAWTQQAYIKASNAGPKRSVRPQPLAQPRREYAGGGRAVGSERRDRRER